jgi:hypothetical protein
MVFKRPSNEMKEAIFERLKHSIQLLASSPQVQLQLLPPFACKADEIALDFNHWLEVTLDKYKGDLSLAQLSALKAIDEKLHWLTADSKEHWTDEAVHSSPEWECLRSLATNALQLFGWAAEMPPSYEHEYVPTDQRKRI